MKRKFAIFVLFCLIFLFGCSVQIAPAATQTSKPTQNPTPQPTLSPTIYLFRSLANGTFIKSGNKECKPCHQITVVNGKIDAVVVLQYMESIVNYPRSTLTPAKQIPTITFFPSSNKNAVYIRANQSFTFSGFVGFVRMCFTQGEDWDSKINLFTRRATYSCLKDNLILQIPVFKYQKITITLDPVSGGTTEIVPKTKDSFPLLF
jgi:hypothetical protein